MPHAPKFSILIISYNSADDLVRLFDCLEKQTYKNFETILIDNNSNHKPFENEQRRADVFIQNSENTGFAKANNQASKLAKAEWIINLNPDAFPDKNWLNEINIATEKYDCDAFGSTQLLDGFELFDGVGDCFSIFGIAWRGEHRKAIFEFKDNEVFSPCAAASVWKTARFKELGGYEESFNSYYEDVDLGFRHRIMGGKCIQLSKAIVSHRGSGSSSRYSEYAVFHGIRNRFWAFVRLMPSWIMWALLLPHILMVILFGLHAIYRGAGKPYFNGVIAGLRGFGKSYKERKTIQKSRKTSIIEILKPMSFNPFAMLMRRGIFRDL